MDNFRPDSYCGLYCGACEIANLHRSSLETGIPAGWEQLPERFRAHIKRAELICGGCKSNLLFEGCKGCAIRACASKKGVEACVVCGEYPCRNLQEGLRNVSEELKRTLPHTKVMFKNTDLIKEKGIEAWINDQEKKWRCPQCGKPFTWYQESCKQCGRELESIKDYNNY